MKKTTEDRGYIVYRGPSVLDGSPIVAVATLKTSNGKTGNMVQVWILPDKGRNPLKAVQTNDNFGACGTCPLQGVYDETKGKIVDRVCYVNLGQAPNAVYNGLERGIYPTYDPARHEKTLLGRKMRLGAYGDPAALPAALVAYLSDVGTGHTGYSHQLLWMERGVADELAKRMMASCHTPAMRTEAKKRGYRTFTVLSDHTQSDGDLECPNYTHGIQCEQCGLCNGSDGGGRSIYVIAHSKNGLNLPKHQ